MQGLTPKTASVIDKVSLLECIKPYTLVGGTALSLQLNTRLSEDLDFMSWRENRDDKCEVDWPRIKKEFDTIGNVSKIDILGFDHVEFLLDGVKVSFYASPNFSPIKNRTAFKNNLYLADKIAIGAMKMEVLLRRSKFRDYYDLYSLLMAGEDLHEMITLALKYSSHRLKSKNLISMITNSERFIPEESFALLAPKYNVTPQEIESLIKSKFCG